MFIRKKKNKSGTYSILLLTGERVPGKIHPISRMIKNFGSSADASELKKLITEAEAYKNHLQLASPKAKFLKIASDVDLNSCRSFNVGFSDVYGQTFSSIFNTINLKDNLIQRLKNIVVMRIAEPCSKRRTANVATEYGILLNVDTIYKLMDQINAPIINQVKKIIYSHTAELLQEQKRTIDVLFYDLTTIYFETNTQDEIRDFGFSKDGKHQHVQIMLAIIVTKEGLLIDYEEFPGNSYEGHTLIPVLHKIQERYHIDNTVIVADAALMNRINLQELNENGIKYIIAARLKNAKKDIKKIVLDDSDYKLISSFSNLGDETYDAIKSKSISCETGDTIFAYHSTKRARKDAYDREKDLERIKKYLSSTAKSKLTGSLKKSYVKISKDCKIEIDYEKLKLEARYDGFFGLRTNITDADPIEILGSYRGLWQVEQTFRIAKTNLEIRPVFHYTPRRIRAHFLICYMALSLIRHVEFKLKTKGISIPCDELYLLLSRMRKVQIVNASNELFEFLEDPPMELIPAYLALKIKWHQKFKYIEKM